MNKHKKSAIAKMAIANGHYFKSSNESKNSSINEYEIITYKDTYYR